MKSSKQKIEAEGIVSEFLNLVYHIFSYAESFFNSKIKEIKSFISGFLLRNGLFCYIINFIN